MMKSDNFNYGSKCDAVQKVNLNCPYLNHKQEYAIEDIAFAENEDFKVIEDTFFMPCTASKEGVPSLSLLLVRESTLQNQLIKAKRRLVADKNLSIRNVDLKKIKKQLASRHKLLFETRRGEVGKGKNYRNYSFDFPAYSSSGKTRVLAFILSPDEWEQWHQKSQTNAVDKSTEFVNEELIAEWFDTANNFVKILKNFGRII